MQNFILRDPTSEDLEFLAEIKFTNQQIEERASELCEQIKLDLKNIDILVSIMDGAYYWSNLLEKNLNPTNRIDTNISFYESDEVKEVSDSELAQVDFTNKNVLISENIIATGRTISAVITKILESKPKTIAVCTMIDNPEVRIQKYLFFNDYIKYIGFKCLKDEFLCGYGIRGLNPLPQELRNIKHIYRVKETPALYWKFTKEN